VSKRRKELPLDDPRWLPLAAAYTVICQRTGDPYLAARDLTGALADERLRSMRRSVEPFNPSRELLPPSFWAKHEIDSWDGKLFVVTTRVGANVRGSSISAAFYVWRPDFEKIWPTEHGPPAEPQHGRKKLEKSGRPATIKRHDLRIEIVRRCWRAGTFIAPGKQTDLALELQDWHKREFKSEPNYEDLRKLVGEVIAVLKIVGK